MTYINASCACSWRPPTIRRAGSPRAAAGRRARRRVGPHHRRAPARRRRGAGAPSRSAGPPLRSAGGPRVASAACAALHLFEEPEPGAHGAARTRSPVGVGAMSQPPIPGGSPARARGEAPREGRARAGRLCCRCRRRRSWRTPPPPSQRVVLAPSCAARRRARRRWRRRGGWCARRRGLRRRCCRLRRRPAVTPYRRRHRLRWTASPRVQVRDDLQPRRRHDGLCSRRRRSCLGRRRSLGRRLRRPQRHRHLRRRRRLADHERLELGQTSLHRVELGESRLHRVEVRRRHLGGRLRLGRWRSRHCRRVGGDLLRRHAQPALARRRIRI